MPLQDDQGLILRFSAVRLQDAESPGHCMLTPLHAEHQVVLRGNVPEPQIEHSPQAKLCSDVQGLAQLLHTQFMI